MVTNQRETPAGKLDPDLMAPTCVKPYMDQAGFSGGKPPEFQPSFLDAASLPLYHEDLVLFSIFPE